MAKASKGLGTWIACAIATGGGAGYAPVAPGTAGTLVAVPIAWALADVTWITYGLVVLAITLGGVACARAADRAWGTHDSGRIVIDEIAGYLVTMAAVDRHRPLLLAAGFVLFRVLDIVKPPPAGWIDRRMPGGAGVVLDDVMAGAYGGVLLWLGQRYLFP